MSYCVVLIGLKDQLKDCCCFKSPRIRNTGSGFCFLKVETLAFANKEQLESGFQSVLEKAEPKHKVCQGRSRALNGEAASL